MIIIMGIFKSPIQLHNNLVIVDIDKKLKRKQSGSLQDKNEMQQYQEMNPTYSLLNEGLRKLSDNHGDFYNLLKNMSNGLR